MAENLGQFDEKVLIAALKDGDEKAFNEIYKRYWNQVRHFASLYLTDKEVIRDVVQDVFVNLWDVKCSLRESEDFKGFLFIITRNIVFKRSRRSFNDSFYELTLISALERSYSVEDEISARDLEALIDRLVKEMPPKRQQVFLMSRKECKSYREIAQLLNISEKTVERHINEALKILKKNLFLYVLFMLSVN